MSVSTRFTELVGCELPLQLAAMGGVGTTQLAGAVVTAGGMGMVPAGTAPVARACGTNFLMPFEPSLDDIAEEAGRSLVVEFFYGYPRTDVVEVVHGEEALAGWQVGSASEAEAAAECGCDYVVAQGIEAGGHVRGTQRLNEVLPETLDAVSIPVVAAGGVTTAHRFAELMQAGADAVRVGTRFVPCPESAAHPEYVAELLAAGKNDTLLTEWYGDGWQAAPHRVLSSAVESAVRSGWRSPIPPHRDIQRNPGDMAMYAGMGVADVTVSEPAVDVVADLVSLL